MMVDLEQIINSLVDGSLLHKRKIEKLEGDLKRAFDEIAALRRASTVSSQQHQTQGE